MSEPDFTVEILPERYLPGRPRGQRHRHGDAVGPRPRRRPGPGRSELIMIDCSGSMGSPADQDPRPARPPRRRSTCSATASRSRSWRAPQRAGRCSRRDGSLAGADPQTGGGERAVARLQPGGGTAIGQWLSLAHQLFDPPGRPFGTPSCSPTARTSTRRPSSWTRRSACARAFQLRLPRRGHRLGGGGAADGLHRPARHRRHHPRPGRAGRRLRGHDGTRHGQAGADVALRVWTPQDATVRFVKQVAPTVEDLTARAYPVARRPATTPPARGEREPRLPRVRRGRRGRGRAGDAGRPGQPGRRRRRARSRPGAGPGGLDRRQGPVHPDQPAGRPLHRPGGAGRRIQEGLEARKPGDEDTATAKLGRAVELAQHPATRTRPSCWPRWSTSSTRRPARSGSRRRWRTPTRWRSTPDRPRPSGPGSRWQVRHRGINGHRKGGEGDADLPSRSRFGKQ